ncbi:cytosolic protein [Alkalihalobacillus deserti]|uniref:cytosolic protein n=1 Tax=Alkalihalobacillus deserti TaxID=2879466 RepID=UPI001D153531|nr:cytosolic protein [Alkalihalobacillus deserti]
MARHSGSPDKEGQVYTDFSNVETQRNFLVAEDLPDGPYGSPFNKDKPVENKSTPWLEGQRYYSNFNYEFKSLHQNLPRQFPGAHPTHDDPNKNEEPPYTTNDLT